MKKGFTSIIMTCYDQRQTARHMSMLAAANITRFTDPKDYELIIVDCCPKYSFRDDYKCLKIDHMIEVPPPDIGYYPAMNLGVEKAQGEYLCFIENDVFVDRFWLPQLREYLELDLLDAVLPNQIPCSFEKQEELDNILVKEAIGKGAAEQGLILMKRESFDKIGGWDKNLKAGYGWKRFYQQMNENNVRFNNTSLVTISHITGAAYYDTLEDDPVKHAKNSEEENKYLNGQS